MSGPETVFDHVLAVAADTELSNSIETRRRQQAAHTAHADTGVDPEYISMFENFHAMTSAELHTMASSLNPVAMTTLAREWHSLRTGFAESVPVAAIRILQKLEEGWADDTGAAAAEAVRLFASSASRMSSAAGATAQKLWIAAEIAEQVKAAMPAPQRGPDVLLLLDPTAGADAARAEEAQRAAMVRVMENIYKPNYRDSGSAVPVLPSPHTVAGIDGDGGSASRRGGSTTGAHSDGAAFTGGDTASGRDGTSGNFVSGDSAPPVDGSAESEHDGSGPNGTGHEGTGSDGTDRDGASTTPASTLPSSAQAASAPAGNTPGAAGGGTAQPYGSSPGSSGSSYGNTGGGYGPGGGIAGTAPPLASHRAGGTLVGAPTGPAAATQAGTGRGTGMRPYGMMPGAAAPAAARGDEQDKRVASYLVTNDNGNELIGSLPDTAPPVLGVDPL